MIKELYNIAKQGVKKIVYPVTLMSSIITACAPQTIPVEAPIKSLDEMHKEYVTGADDSLYKYKAGIKAHEERYDVLAERLKDLYEGKRDFLEEWEDNLKERLEEIKKDRKAIQEKGLEGLSSDDSSEEKTEEETGPLPELIVE